MYDFIDVLPLKWHDLIYINQMFTDNLLSNLIALVYLQGIKVQKNPSYLMTYLFIKFFNVLIFEQYLHVGVQSLPSKHVAFAHCCLNAGPPLAQH